MKEIKAIIQPFRLSKVRAAFRHVCGFPGMTVSRADGVGHHVAKHKSSIQEDLTDYSPKIRIEIVAPDDMVEGILQILLEIGHTGQAGDGIVWVTPVERMVRLAEQVCVLDEVSGRK